MWMNDSDQLLLDTRIYLETQNVRFGELFPLIFSMVSDVYHEENNNKGYLSFVSHVPRLL